MSMRGLAGFVALLAVLVGSACGGGGDGDRLTREEFTSQANAICRDFDKKIDAIDEPQSIADVVDFADEAIPIFEDGLNRLGELEPPEDLQAKVDEWLGVGDEILEALRDLRDAAEDKNQARVQQILREAQTKDDRSDTLATQIGATDCADD